MPLGGGGGGNLLIYKALLPKIYSLSLRLTGFLSKHYPRINPFFAKMSSGCQDFQLLRCRILR